MDDFNREKRFFTIDEVKDFAQLSLNNYYMMNDSVANPEASNQFENYLLRKNASLFVLALDPGNQTNSTYPLQFNRSAGYNSTNP